MELMNERNQVRTVATRFRVQYGAASYGADTRGRAVGDELSALDVESATAEEVAEIVGNGSWVSMSTCHECGNQTWEAVQLGEPPDYESHTAIICGDCLRAALDLLGKKSPP